MGYLFGSYLALGAFLSHDIATDLAPIKFIFLLFLRRREVVLKGTFQVHFRDIVLRPIGEVPQTQPRAARPYPNALPHPGPGIIFDFFCYSS